MQGSEPAPPLPSIDIEPVTSHTDLTPIGHTFQFSHFHKPSREKLLNEEGVRELDDSEQGETMFEAALFVEELLKTR